MCFSSTASFTSGAVLVVISAISLNKSTNPGQRLLGFIPMVFGLQQLTEGVLWLALLYPKYQYLQQACTVAFLLVAQVIWPIIVPLTMYVMETDRKRKKILAWLLLFGLGIGIYVFYCLFNYPVRSSVLGYHIKYHLVFPLSNTLISAIAYLVPTVIPPFVSSFPQIRWLGGILVAAFIVTTVFYKEYTISVWCFFASLISILCMFIILELRKESVPLNAETV